MMNIKNYKILLTAIFGLLLLTCQDEDQEFGDVIAPSNLTLTFEIVGVDAENPNGDGSGFVNFTATADNAITYRYNFGDNTDVEVAPSGDATHRFNLTGLNTYNVTVIASGTGGVTTSTAVSVAVFSAFDDQEAKELLSGGVGSSKVWYLAASEVGHLGVGGTPEISADAFWFPSFFAAQPFEKCNDEISDCLCDDELTFSLDADNNLTYQLNNNGQTFFNVGHQGVIGEDAGEDACFEFDTSGVSNVSLAPSSFDWSSVPDPNFNARGTTMNFSNDAFMGYYVSSSSYDIISVTENTLYVRTIDGLNPVLYWYHKFSTDNPADAGSNDLETVFNDLVWQDEFDTDGAPNPANWTYDIGTGDNGWGNGESQYYTDEADNIIVEDGVLKITAKAESFMGSNYTSSRIKTENLFEFTNGRVEIRAKLPTGAGTWPALWTLGANYDTNPWPACGEMDIMEHVGNTQNTIFSTMHYPGNSGGDGVGANTNISTVSSEFHTYTMEWKDDEILFAVDNIIHFTFENNETLPFNSDFFLIMNVAMGGSFGGAIDPAFVESTMEVDYVRVYQ
ncbi:family 16 glycosylhydrolase [Psychroserpens sp. SPM9]|uniref:family 16 glycosylhydrolase n=1 Tax=Psychroserpens sp. SPM9 TaxID=2975598 RepID=UPI0021A29181|nr:family 16 glycosylhydrolase [Psychroserpens sp. SPM9]MDG5491341.1 family 16 glycosylhydrolase [Psychroserpens sp. SPM9]